MEKAKRRGRPSKVVVQQILSPNEQRIQEITREATQKLEEVLFNVKKDFSITLNALAKIQGTMKTNLWKKELQELSQEIDYEDFELKETIFKNITTPKAKRGRPRKVK